MTTPAPTAGATTPPTTTTTLNVDESGTAGEKHRWGTTLLGCWRDPALCVLVYFVPCYISGKVSEKMDGHFWKGCLFSLIPVLQTVQQAVTRGKIREQNNIAGTTTGDVLFSFLCPFCVLNQMAQEIHAWPNPPPETGPLLTRQ